MAHLLSSTSSDRTKLDLPSFCICVIVVPYKNTPSAVLLHFHYFWLVGCWRGCLGWGADLHIAKQMPLPLTIYCSSKSRLVLTFLVLPFWYLLTQVVPDIIQKSSKQLYVCVCVCVYFCHTKCKFNMQKVATHLCQSATQRYVSMLKASFNAYKVLMFTDLKPRHLQQIKTEGSYHYYN